MGRSAGLAPSYQKALISICSLEFILSLGTLHLVLGPIPKFSFNVGALITKVGPAWSLYIWDIFTLVTQSITHFMYLYTLLPWAGQWHNSYMSCKADRWICAGGLAHICSGIFFYSFWSFAWRWCWAPILMTVWSTIMVYMSRECSPRAIEQIVKKKNFDPARSVDLAMVACQIFTLEEKAILNNYATMTKSTTTHFQLFFSHCGQF